MSNVDIDERVRCVIEPDTCTIVLEEPVSELGIVHLIARDEYDADHPQAVVLALDLGAARELARQLKAVIDSGQIDHWTGV